MTDKVKVGLVLSGGGAKGAYQAGAVKALSDLKVQVDALSGASIGALNGAVLASAPTFAEGAERLERVWRRLTESPLQGNVPSYFSLLASAGLHLYGAGVVDACSRALRAASQKAGVELPKTLQGGLLTDEPLREMIETYVDIKAMSKGLPLFVSVYPSAGGFADTLRMVASGIGLLDTPESKYLHVQSLSSSEQEDALLASAAIPLLYAPKYVDGMLATDGGQGGWQRQRSNTPAKPLVDAGCNLLLVTHLNDGSLWSRQNFPDATILEIRPQSNISRSKGAFPGVKDVLGFNSDNIAAWLEQGYADCMSSVKPVLEAVTTVGDLKRSAIARDRSIAAGEDVDRTFDESMSWLRAKNYRDKP